MDKYYTPVYILTWNPKRFAWNTYKQEVAKAKSGELSANWSCRSKQPRRGDRFILLMQGMGNTNGVIGYGHFSGRPADIGFDTEYGKTYAEIVFTALIDYEAEEYVKTRQLKALFPVQCWVPQGSGIRVKSACVPKLWRMITGE